MATDRALLHQAGARPASPCAVAGEKAPGIRASVVSAAAAEFDAFRLGVARWRRLQLSGRLRGPGRCTDDDGPRNREDERCTGGADPKDEQLAAARVDRPGGQLTTDQGVLVDHTDDSLSAGERDPTLLEDFHLIRRIVARRGIGGRTFASPPRSY